MAAFPSKSIPGEVQYCLETFLSHGGFVAFCPVFGSNLADWYSWQEADGNSQFAQDTSTSGQIAQQWKLRMMALEANSDQFFKSTHAELEGVSPFLHDSRSEECAALAWAGRDSGF